MKVSDRLKYVLKFLVTLLVATAVAVGVAMIPVPYVIQTPGPTVDVLGTQGDTEVLQVDEVPEDLGLHLNEDGDGEIRMVTVSEVGGPGSTVRVADVVSAWFQASAKVLRYSDVYPDEITADEVQQMSSAQMESSHSAAQITAFDYLGVPMETTMTVVGTVPGTGAEKVLEEGDVLKAITLPNGTVFPVASPSVPFTLLRSVPAGSTLSVLIERDGKEETVEITTTASTDSETGEVEEGSKMGAYLDADVEAPFDVTIHLEKVGGPSAGLAFALGIVDRFTEGGLTNGQKVAATGVLDYSAHVSPVGGIKQKMFGAKRDGAEWFLLPQANCEDTMGGVPAGLTVVPVSTLEEGLDAVEKIAAGDTGDLPSCPAA